MIIILTVFSQRERVVSFATLQLIIITVEGRDDESLHEDVYEGGANVPKGSRYHCINYNEDEPHDGEYKSHDQEGNHEVSVVRSDSMDHQAGAGELHRAEHQHTSTDKINSFQAITVPKKHCEPEPLTTHAVMVDLHSNQYVRSQCQPKNGSNHV